MDSKTTNVAGHRCRDIWIVLLPEHNAGHCVRNYGDKTLCVMLKRTGIPFEIQSTAVFLSPSLTVALILNELSFAMLMVSAPLVFVANSSFSWVTYQTMQNLRFNLPRHQVAVRHAVAQCSTYLF